MALLARGRASAALCLMICVSGCGTNPRVVDRPYPVITEVPAALTQAVPMGGVPTLAQLADPLEIYRLWDDADAGLAVCNIRLSEIARLSREQARLMRDWKAKAPVLP